MSNEKRKYTKFRTPAGIAVWPRLSPGKPDTKFKPEGEYSAKLRLDPNDKNVQAFLAFLDEQTEVEAELQRTIFKEANKPAKIKSMKIEPAYKPELDKEGEETGFVTVNCKMKAKVTAKATGIEYVKVPFIVDAKGSEIKGDPKIGGGSTLKVAGILAPYYVESTKGFGLTLRLEGVQVLDLKQFGGARTAGDFGFESEEGYEAEEGAFVDETANVPAAGAKPAVAGGDVDF